ncbi:MAG TPA: TIGR03032 family protein [Rhodanobacteraceae bacterium]|nr:TIGR03032 family protein [Rhodanobacteraceae bacterium]
MSDTPPPAPDAAASAAAEANAPAGSGDAGANAAAAAGDDAARDTDEAQPSAAEALSSVHTANLPEVLRQLGGCLVVSTYQAGKLVILRPDGAGINTHYRSFNRPMGMAADGERLALGAQIEIAEFRNMPAVAARLHNPPRHDAVFLARRGHITGAIDIHEMAWDGDGDLWFVNTLFSCLCTLDAKSSFVPRWRPPCVSHYAPEDRCHLNGLAMRDGKPRYVTALGTTNTPQGWRANKRDGGVLMDVRDNRIITDGLSMPHSPRWYDGKLWVLESGRGALVTVNPKTGERTDVARVPGFCRGIDFLGPVAFIGLSQLRETNAFTDIPITEDNAERQSGVWAVHLGTGKTIAFLKFTGGVQEIFAVQALRGALFPEIISDGDYLKTSYALPDEALKEVQRTPQDAASPGPPGTAPAGTASDA